MLRTSCNERYIQKFIEQQGCGGRKWFPIDQNYTAEFPVEVGDKMHDALLCFRQWIYPCCALEDSVKQHSKHPPEKLQI